MISNSEKIRDDLKMLAKKNADGTTFTLPEGATAHQSDVVKQNIPLHT